MPEVFWLLTWADFMRLLESHVYLQNQDWDKVRYQSTMVANCSMGRKKVIKPKDLLFANEKCPSSSPEIFERIDKELLKNTYWQSNTLLYFKRANKFFPIIEKILEENNIPDDFKYLVRN